MASLRRVEIWVLLGLVLAGLVWVFMSGGSAEEENTVAIETNPSAPLALLRRTLKRDFGNARLDLDVRVRHDGAEPLIMQPPKVKLLNAQGREVPSFFLPFDRPPEVPARSTADVQLRYWLEAADLQGVLTLEVDGKTLAVKSAKPVDLNSLPNGEEKVVKEADW